MTLANTISTAPVDIITLRITNASDHGRVPDDPANAPQELQMSMAKQLTEAIGGNLVQIFGVPDGVNPMLEWKYRWVAENDKFKMTWTAVFRTGPDENPFFTDDGAAPEAEELRDLPSATQTEMQRFLRGLVGDRVVPKGPPNQDPWN